MTNERPELDLGHASSQVLDVLAPVAVDTAYSYRAPGQLRSGQLKSR